MTAAAAIGTSLFVEFSGFASGVVGYLRRQLVDMRTVRALVVVSVPVAAAAGFLAGAIDPRLLKAIYGVLMLPLAVVLWRQSSEELRPRSSDPRATARRRTRTRSSRGSRTPTATSTSGERATAAPDVR